ncbi:4-hydroxy-4-methyl-2-oxoglutarate aldolase [Lipingzhangella halophila]|uniref:Putative 4-hydroxy-4-methyl-2-oxoglutarate aldolase n=1 Tax=Lipingzhangella halophila TaxID=1783352 RepID=A0A7W7W600_9ACTN|nr:4-carboxy-4-hydroxy-2-oxoadipate aldolase/oxaloacetate decarboxylase [Lipingzhangella halophila]MBB4935278.1 4-hydroxy-4-methyl-2-oxoglutarate aldolase [Lipingzhangella halophila]
MSGARHTEAVAELAEAGVATVYEAAGRSGLVDADLESLIPGTRVAGPARIALCGQDDNRAVHEVMAHLRPGEVLVLAMPEPRPVALLGDLLATQAKARGAAGVLVDASVRDVADLRAIGLPVWTRWRRVRGATKNVRGSVDVPVRVGGTEIAPQDIVVLDDDGAAAVPLSRVESTVAAVRERIAKEDGLRERWSSGELSYDAYGLRAEDEASDQVET